MKKNILIVEDQIAIVNFIKNRLDKNIYSIDIAYDGKEALKKIEKKLYDLITLDFMVPFFDGIEICKTIRQKTKKTLILMISAINNEDIKLNAYGIGIDDFIVKPFSAKELSFKIKALLHRREELVALKEEVINGIIIKEESREIILNGFSLDFTPSEYLILSILYFNKNRVYSRNEFTQLIYDNDLGVIDDRGIDTHICNIRKKIKVYEEKNLIKTVRGMGYKINED